MAGLFPTTRKASPPTATQVPSVQRPSTPAPARKCIQLWRKNFLEYSQLHKASSRVASQPAVTQETSWSTAPRRRAGLRILRGVRGRETTAGYAGLVAYRASNPVAALP